MQAGWKTSVAIRAAWACLRQHRWRSLATLALCSLGTAGVLLAGLLNRAHVAEMQGRLRNLGSGLLMVTPNKLSASPGRPRQIDQYISLAAEDAHALAAQVPQLQQVVPVATRSVNVRLGGQAIRVRLIGTTAAYLRVRGFTMARGRFFAPAEDGERVIVLGHAVHAELQAENALSGPEVMIGSASYQIVGVLAPQGVNFAGEDEDRQAFMPLETYSCQIANRPWLDALYLQMALHADSVQTRRLVEKVLSDRHGRWPEQLPDVVVRDFADLAAQQSDLLATVAWVISVTSALLIVMGAVGIATLMVLVVRQRRVEIGLRRALGATPGDIALQFFLEGFALAAAGVFAGLLIGLAAGAVLSGLGVLTGPFDPILVLGSAAFSLSSAAAACAIPALLAARLEPSVALRS
jgi:putative ABC transport system permease protein